MTLIVCSCMTLYDVLLGGHGKSRRTAADVFFDVTVVFPGVRGCSKCKTPIETGHQII